MAKLKQQIRWLSAAAVITVLSLVLVFGLDGQAQAQMAAPQAPRPAQPVQFGPGAARLAQAGGEQIFRGDLVVEPGRVIDGDVAVYSGDVQVDEGGQIQGNLVVYSGDLEIRPGGSVGGDVTTFSGDIEIAGRVGGNIASWSGDVGLASTARVEGGVSVLSGEIRREQGAYVGGSVAKGPQLRLPGAPSRELPVPPSTALRDRSVGFLGWIGQLFLRLIGAVLLTALATLLVGVLAYAAPELVSRVRRQMNENLALSFVIGLLTNLVLLLLAGLLSATICLLPIALVPILLLLGINLVGWTAVSQVAGERVSAWVKQPVQPALAAAVGAVVLTGVMALLWAMGGCFRFIGFLAMLGVGSFGAGAVLLPWLSGRRTGGGP
ncbi:MAG: polymer-forming cytoskeletal protein, partial [Caldilineaceae bacterium]|nr:polymer-forming cytoskeletal protein [Caldilineaceae bacterium]